MQGYWILLVFIGHHRLLQHRPGIGFVVLLKDTGSTVFFFLWAIIAFYGISPGIGFVVLLKDTGSTVFFFVWAIIAFYSIGPGFGLLVFLKDN
jgi:hypothetical protein